MDQSAPAPGASQTLDLWERAEPLPPLRRGHVLAEWGAEADRVSEEPIGSVHARLLRLRRAQSGPLMAATVDCPNCGARVEFELDADSLLALQERATNGSVELPDDIAEWRPPSWADLDGLPDGEGRGTAMLRRCIRLADDRDPATLAPDVVEEIEQAMMTADPLAEVLVASACPHCEHRFEASVDIVDFVWTELDARAKRLLHEVDLLARAYGWTESQVFALSDQRRAAYLRLIVEGAP